MGNTKFIVELLTCHDVFECFLHKWKQSNQRCVKLSFISMHDEDEKDLEHAKNKECFSSGGPRKRKKTGTRSIVPLPTYSTILMNELQISHPLCRRLRLNGILRHNLSNYPTSYRAVSNPNCLKKVIHMIGYRKAIGSAKPQFSILSAEHVV